MIKLKKILFVCFILCLFVACKNATEVDYFQDISRNNQLLAAQVLRANRVQVGDRLNIIVTSPSTPDIAVRYNLPMSALRVGALRSTSENNVMPYYVDEQGNIEMPEIGKIRVVGLTREEVRKNIRDIIVNRNILRDAVITVEILSHYVYVLGDVARPGRISIDKDNITILEALAQAGDMSITGRRDRIMVLRNEKGEQRSYLVNLLDAESLVKSPVYQLQPGDCIYVSPNQKRQNESLAIGNTWNTPGIYLSLTSVLLSAVVLLSNLLRK